jgi:hypothetical protein
MLKLLEINRPFSVSNASGILYNWTAKMAKATQQPIIYCQQLFTNDCKYIAKGFTGQENILTSTATAMSMQK